MPVQRKVEFQGNTVSVYEKSIMIKGQTVFFGVEVTDEVLQSFFDVILSFQKDAVENTKKRIRSSLGL